MTGVEREAVISFTFDFLVCAGDSLFGRFIFGDAAAIFV